MTPLTLKNLIFRNRQPDERYSHKYIIIPLELLPMMDEIGRSMVYENVLFQWWELKSVANTWNAHTIENDGKLSFVVYGVILCPMSEVWRKLYRDLFLHEYKTDKHDRITLYIILHIV